MILFINMFYFRLGNKIQTILPILFIIWVASEPALAQETTVRLPVIAEIRFDGNTTFSSETLRSQLTFSVGTAFSRPLLLEGKYYISNFYSDNGFKYNLVTLEYFINESTAEVKALYH